MEAKDRSHIRKGLFIAGALIVLEIAGYYSGLKFTYAYNGILWLALLLSFFVVTFMYSRKFPARTPFGVSFSYGFKTAAVVASLFFLYQLLAVNVFFPDIKQRLLDMAREKAKNTMNFSADEMALFRKLIAMKETAGSILQVLIAGLVGAACGGLFNRRNP